MLDVAHRTIDSPVGRLLLAATPEGLLRIAFETEDHEAVLARLLATPGLQLVDAPHRLDAAAAQIDEYLTGQRRAFEIHTDLRNVRGLRRVVLAHLALIPYGATESYASVAAAVGSPRAVRAVGTACATNPLPLVIPCHRVVRSDGSTGRYGGGAGLKRALLAMEADDHGSRRVAGDPALAAAAARS